MCVCTVADATVHNNSSGVVVIWAELFSKTTQKKIIQSKELESFIQAS